MSLAADTGRAANGRRILSEPLFVLAVATALLPLILSLPLSLPIGPMYWDLFIYFDAANRIYDGQVPINDFFVPVGPLGYYLFAGGLKLFPNAQPLLLASWSLLAVTAPLMAIVLWEVGKRSRGAAFGLLVPFLIFALLPFNTREFYPFPGSNGFGIYNRQASQLLYVLSAALVFMRGQRLLALVVAAAMLALFLTKITGFVAGFVLCLFAFAAGRIAFRHAAAAAAGFFAALAALELLAGAIVSHYFRDILALVALNDGAMASRFVQAASQTFGVLAPAGLLMLILLWQDRTGMARDLGSALRKPALAAIAALLDRDWLWLGTLLFCGILFETQNTGSQGMILVWPVLLRIVMKAPLKLRSPRLLFAALGLAAAAALPVAVNVVDQAARAYVGALKNVPLEHRNLKTLGAVTMRDTVRLRADRMMGFYPRHEAAYTDFLAIGELPTPVLYSDYDFQITHLMAIDRAVDSIRALEREHGIRFETMMTIAFVNTFPYLMGRHAPEHIAIGADPTRAVPEPNSEEAEAIRGVDMALYPRCPTDMGAKLLLDLYQGSLKDHRRIQLDDCYDAFVHPRLATRLP